MRIGAVLLAAFLLTGCQSMMERAGLAISGPGVEIDNETLTGFIDRQDKAIELLGALAYGKDNNVTAKLKAGTASEQEWTRTVYAGIHFADVRCEHYMEALFKYNRTIRTTSTQLSILGGATAATLAAVEAAAKEVALTAVAFGLAVASLDNVGGSVLYQIDPSTVRNLVEEQQKTFMDDLKTKEDRIDNRVDALRTVQAYVSLCLPAVIENNVANAIKAGTHASTRGTDRWGDMLRTIELVDKDLAERLRAALTPPAATPPAPPSPPGDTQGTEDTPAPNPIPGAAPAPAPTPGTAPTSEVSPASGVSPTPAPAQVPLPRSGGPATRQDVVPNIWINPTR
ncbi:hypothetical protein [Oceanibaculum sp.]|uniref:hypothetical protein n=1 Tax=Oceanibaculum sp. TaxID=1903597 RepID=UPI00258A0C9B|nr:hypothetical protein [Oceanibaculum sp.]MCH2394409.1 hypothetical protein [Oceanibaculum sp.]